MSELANELSKLKSNSVSKDKLGLIADLLERHNIDVDDIGSVSKISLWQQAAKDAGFVQDERLAAFPIGAERGERLTDVRHLLFVSFG